jgi:hypothetical protein
LVFLPKSVIMGRRKLKRDIPDMAKSKASDKGAANKAAGKRPDALTYPNGDKPAIKYCDFVRLDSSNDGVMFSFGQSHPRRQSFNILEEIFIPWRVCASLHKILGDQLDVVMKQIREIVGEDEQDEKSK